MASEVGTVTLDEARAVTEEVGRQARRERENAAKRARRAYVAPSSEERFWRKVDRRGPDECWPWLARRNATGYGEFWHANTMAKAHRFALSLKLGRDLAPGECACHSCDNRACVNSAHLWVGTKTENNEDRDRKGRQRTLVGESHGAARLTEDDVRAIRGSALPAKSLATRYGVTVVSISRIRRRIQWGHVE